GVDVVVTQPAVVAHEMPLGLGIDPGTQAVDDVLVAVEVDAAAGGTVGANAVFRLEVPDAVLVQEVLAAQGPDRAQVHNVAGQLVVEGLAGEDVDFRVVAAVDDLQLRLAADLAREAHAARAHDAAVGEQGDVVADAGFVGR